MTDLHVRRQIRDVVAASLVGLPTTGDNVFKSRRSPSGDAKLPALLVYTRAERSAGDGMGTPATRKIARELKIFVVGVCRVAEDSPDDVLDQICVEVEAVLPTVPALVGVGGLLENFILESTDFDVPTEPADKRAGRVGMTWRGIYRTAAATPTQPA
jgi:hypothetical protein